MTRLYSSISVETTLATAISSTQTTMQVVTGTGSALMGGVTLASGNVDQFTVAIDPDTSNEEIVFVTGISGDVLTIVRGRAGSANITHGAGALVRHVLTSDDLSYFNTAIQPAALTARGDMYVATNSGVVSNLPVGSNNQVLTADSTLSKGMKWATPTTGTVTSVTAGTGLTGGTITATGTVAIDTSVVVDLTTAQTLTNKTLTAPVITQGTSSPTFTSNAYTLVSGDAGKLLIGPNSAAIANLYIPTDTSVAFPIGTQITFLQNGSGQVTIQAATSGTTTVYSSGSTTNAPKCRGIYSAITIIKTAADTWYAIGDLA